MSEALMKTDSLHTGIKSQLLDNEILAKYTSWRVGGPAKRFFIPADRKNLLTFLRTLTGAEPLLWIGLGSNLLVRDGGFNGTVIYTRGRLKMIQLMAENLLAVEAGVPCAHVAKYCAEQGLCGAEFFAGIPGTLGGALKMNAGAFGGETWNIVEQVEMVDAQGKVTLRGRDEFNINYRSVLGGIPGEWFLGARLRLQQGNSSNSRKKIRQLLAKRALTQPVNQWSCGSVFKNPEADFAARLIEASGLKGHCIGGARVSDKHANFIINTGQATAADIEALIEYVADEVEQQQQVRLQTEVCIVGEKQLK